MVTPDELVEYESLLKLINGLECGPIRLVIDTYDGHGNPDDVDMEDPESLGFLMMQLLNQRADVLRAKILGHG